MRERCAFAQCARSWQRGDEPLGVAQHLVVQIAGVGGEHRQLAARCRDHVRVGVTDVRPAPTMGVTLIRAAVRDFPAIESAIAAVAAEPGGGLLLLPDVFTTRYRTEIIELVARHRVPTIYPVRDWVPAGGLIAYSSDFNDQFRRAADHVDRILRGVKPADLAVQQPVKYEMALNLKTATALGLSVSTLVLAQADEIIE